MFWDMLDGHAKAMIIINCISVCLFVCTLGFVLERGKLNDKKSPVHCTGIAETGATETGTLGTKDTLLIKIIIP